MSTQKVREVAGIFDDLEKMQNAIRELEVSGFERHQISVLGNERQMKDSLGTAKIDPKKLEDDPVAPRVANVSPEDVGVAQGAIVGGGTLIGLAAAAVAAGGILVTGAALTTIVLGGLGGSAAGGILAKLLGDRYNHFFQKQIDNGGILLWISTPTSQEEEKAKSILSDYGATEIDAHDVDRET